MPPVILDNKMYLGGYIYLRSRVAKGRVYWDCRKLRGGECKARAVTSDPTDGEPVEVYKGVPELDHSHPPNQEETAAGQLTTTLKRKAANHPEQPPAQTIELLCDSSVWFLDVHLKQHPTYSHRSSPSLGYPPDWKAGRSCGNSPCVCVTLQQGNRSVPTSVGGS